MTPIEASTGGRRAAALICACAGLIGGCRATPTPSAVPTEAAAVVVAATADLATGLPTPDFSGILQPGTDLVPKRISVSVDKPALPEWLRAMAAIQIARAGNLAARHDFNLSDKLPETGITFRHKVVPDGAAAFKPNQYDHGNGVAVADVDSDGFLDVYFMSQYGRKELWRNKGDGTFEDITESAGVAFEGKVGVGASFADLDNDGDPDLYVTSVRFGNELYENDGGGLFSNVTPNSGLGYEGHSSAVDFFDYNHDGQLDVFLSNVGIYTSDEIVDGPANPFRPDEDKWYPYYVGLADGFSGHMFPERSESSLLFKNLGGMRFEDVTDAMGVRNDAWNGDAIPFDANSDGWVDLYLVNMQGHDVYYENENGERFIDKSREVFPNTPWGSTGGTVLDYDDDGQQDLYIVDMHSDMNEDVSPVRDDMKARNVQAESYTRSEGRSIWGNAFYRNLGQGSYQEISDSIGAETMWPWGVSAGDLNADGYEDLFIASSMNFAFRYHPNIVLLNDGGSRFTRSEFTLGVEPRRDNAAYKPWFSVDCAKEPDHMLCGGTNQSGRLDAWEPYGSRGSVLFDIEGDGDLDAITLDNHSEPQALFSDLAATGRLGYLVVDLTGTQSNRDGLGAVVTAVAGEDSYQQVNDGQSGYLTQSSMPLYFGLGEHATVDRVIVKWPSGLEQTVSGPIASGTRLEVTEGQ